jgi:GTP-binding protein
VAVTPPTPEMPETMPNPSGSAPPIYQEPVVRSISATEQLRRAQFVTSVAQSAQLPPDRGAEVAFAGRSNAGKSSALNAIADHRGLARVSKTPGRTRLINYFAIDDDHALVDLPGYGYAAVASDMKAGWEQLLGDYLRQRRSLHGVVLIMDCRHPLSNHDQALLDFCAAFDRPVHVLLSKSDKLAHAARQRTLESVRRALAARSSRFSVQLFSATTRTGLEEARTVVARWLGLEDSTDKKNPGNKGKDSGVHK